MTQLLPMISITNKNIYLNECTIISFNRLCIIELKYIRIYNYYIRLI